MIYAIIAAVIAALAWVYNLIRQNGKLKEKAAEEAAKKAIQEWQEKILKMETTIKEDERDYEDAKKDFDSKNSAPGSRPI